MAPNTRWAHEVHYLDARIILSLLRGPGQFNAGDFLNEIRSEIVAKADRGRTRPANWQEAWNLATGASPGRVGQLDFYANNRCTDCHGRRFSMRTGLVCVTCTGRGRSRQHVRFTALAATPPPDAEETTHP